MIDREAPASAPRPARRRRRRLLLLPLLALPAGALAVGVATADPSADFTWSPSNPRTNQTITFTAVSDCGAPNITCSWIGATGDGNGQTATASFSTAGDHNVTLVLDDTSTADAASSQQKAVPVQNDAPPVSFSGESGTVNKNTSYTFTNTSGPDPDGDPVSYSWSLSGSGANVTTNTESQLTVSWSSEGAKSVTLTANDGQGHTPSADRNLTVQDRPPTAAFTISPNPAARNASITFDAGGSGDPDGDALTYNWDFGDGVTFATASSSITHNYAAGGTYPVGLTVTSAGGQDSASSSVTIVNGIPNTTLTNIAPNPAQYNLPVGFSATAADPENAVSGFRWSWNGPGQQDGTLLTGAGSMSRTFPVPGAYAISVVAIDDEGAEDPTPATGTLTILNLLPTADFTVSPNPPEKNQTITLTSTSSDPESRLNPANGLGTFRWDLNGDGQFGQGDESSFNDEGTATVTFNDSRTHLVGLRVTDEDGGQHDKTIPLTPGNKNPKPNFTVDPDAPTANAPVTLKSTSTDDDGTITSYEWDVDGDEDFSDVPNAATVTTTFPRDGTYKVSLRVRDEDGGFDVERKDVQVGAANGSTARPSSGSLPFDTTGSTDNGTPLTPTNFKLMKPFPVVRFAGKLARRGAFFRLITVRAKKGSRIEATCAGKGCKKRAKNRKLRARRTMTKLSFLHGWYGSGARIAIRVTSGNAIGKYTKVVVRRNRAPRRIDKCLIPNRSKPAACPRS